MNDPEKLDLDAIDATMLAAADGPYSVGDELVDPNDPAWNVLNEDGAAIAAFCTLPQATMFAAAPEFIRALVARVRSLEASMTRAADVARLGELQARRWMWLRNVTSGNLEAEEFPFDGDEEISRLLRRINGLPEDRP